MKKSIILSLFMCLLAIPAMAQGKLLESNMEKRPVWVKKDVSRYDVMKVCQTSTASLEEAKDKAFEELYNFIANTVTTYLIGTNVEGTDINVLRQRVEDSQYMKNISESTAIQTYWEHRLYKKEDLYKYYVLYEFNDIEKRKIALEINHDASKTNEVLNEL